MQKFPRRNVVEKPIAIRHPLVLAQHVCFLAHCTRSRPNQAKNSERNSRRRSVINRSTVGYQPVVGLSIRGGHAQPTVSISQESTKSPEPVSGALSHRLVVDTADWGRVGHCSSAMSVRISIGNGSSEKHQLTVDGNSVSPGPATHVKLATVPCCLAHAQHAERASSIE
jgi:hypothetical protein